PRTRAAWPAPGASHCPAPPASSRATARPGTGWWPCRPDSRHAGRCCSTSAAGPARPATTWPCPSAAAPPSRPAAAVTASASSTTPAPAGGHTPASSSERGAHVSVTVLEPDGEALGPAPVLALPLRLDGDRLATLQQGSAAELGQSVRLLM